MDATTEIPTTRINTLFPFLVILTLAIPGILIFWSDYNSPKSTENRSLAPRPALPDNWKDYKTFPTRFQQYVDDHFGFRNTFLSLHNRLQYQVWGTPVLQPGESANPLINQAAAARISNEVLIGRDGWLFFKGDRLLDDARGLRPFSKRDLVEWSNAFKRNQEQLASLGIGYIVVFTPNKSTIYPEYLPAGIHFSEQQRRLPQLVEHLRNETSVNVLNLTTSLRIKKDRIRCYHRTDTHWNEAGAYFSLHEIFNQLGYTPTRLPVPDEIQFEQKPTAGKDLARMLGLEEMMTESALIISEEDMPNFSTSTTEELLLQAGACNRYVNRDESPRLGRVMLYHDSFALDWFPWLAEECNELSCCWSFGLDLDQIKKNRPDLVIHQIVERMLPVRSADELTHP